MLDGRVTLPCSMFQAWHPKPKGPDTKLLEEERLQKSKVFLVHTIFERQARYTHTVIACYSSKVFGCLTFSDWKFPWIFGDFQSYSYTWSFKEEYWIWLSIKEKLEASETFDLKAWISCIVPRLRVSGDDGDVDRECPPHETRETETCDLQQVCLG